MSPNNSGSLLFGSDNGGTFATSVLSLGSDGTAGVNTTNLTDKLNIFATADNTGITISENRSGFAVPAMTYRLDEGTYSEGILVQTYANADNGTHTVSRRGSWHGVIKYVNDALGTVREMFSFDGPTTANTTAISIFDADTFLLKRVMVGTNDSAGTGYKVLKIAN